ncbi:MAG: Tad domain-containing protein [Pseudomonadota bacterium]|nr:Tad domain-containing protein [Pseudomonadota bacterium]
MKRQHGSVLVYCLGLLVVLALSVGYSFNASRISSEKTRLQNTADAASYSVAAVESRDLNFNAYTNRAMVANQVAIAQSISIISWSRFVDRFVANISHLTSFIPPLRAVFAGISRGVSAAVSGMETAISGMIFSINHIEQILSMAQQAHHAGTLAMAHDVYNEVVRRNDPEVDRSFSLRRGMFIADYIHGHQNFTTQYDPGNVTRGNQRSRSGSINRKKYDEHKKRMDEFRSVTLESRDGFSKNRTYDWIGKKWIGPKYQVRVRKTGGSELTGSVSDRNKLGGYYTWSAMDTLAMHHRSLKWGGWSSWDEFIPIGWGAAATRAPRGSRSFSFFSGAGGRHRYASSYRINSWTSKLAAIEYTREGATGRFNGLQPFYDIRKDGLISEAPGVAVMLTKPHSSTAVNTVQHTSFGSGASDLDLESEGGLLNNRLSALSQAVPYFSRPQDVSVFRRSDRLREYGNLYNPFWQPRLSELDDSRRLLGWAVTLL